MIERFGIRSDAKVSRHVEVIASKTSGQILSIQNTQGMDLLIKRHLILVRTGATADCTLDDGVAATSVLDDTLIDGAPVGGAAPNTIYDNLLDGGTHGLPGLLWAQGAYFTSSVASGDANGFVGDFYLDCEPLNRPA